jgi:hypothetical protein
MILQKKSETALLNFFFLITLYARKGIKALYICSVDEEEDISYYIFFFFLLRRKYNKFKQFIMRVFFFCFTKKIICIQN